MAIRQEISEIISAMRKLGRDIPTVMEELFQYLADKIDGGGEPAQAPAPVVEPAPAPAPEPVEPPAAAPIEPEVVLTPEMLAEPAPAPEATVQL